MVLVAALGNRTIINIPLRLVDKPFGAFGVGTFGDAEGCRPPTQEQLDYLVGMASQLSVAASRIRYLDSNRRADQQRIELERRVLEHQKLESLGLLAGGIAHDFNNFLTVILAGTALARLGVDPSDKIVPELDTVVAAAERARDLTRQLLAMSHSQPLVWFKTMAQQSGAPVVSFRDRSAEASTLRLGHIQKELGWRNSSNNVFVPQSPTGAILALETWTCVSIHLTYTSIEVRYRGVGSNVVNTLIADDVPTANVDTTWQGMPSDKRYPVGYPAFSGIVGGVASDFYLDDVRIAADTSSVCPF